MIRGLRERFRPKPDPKPGFELREMIRVVDFNGWPAVVMGLSESEAEARRKVRETGASDASVRYVRVEAWMPK